jgi:hypothetical protein
VEESTLILRLGRGGALPENHGLTLEVWTPAAGRLESGAILVVPFSKQASIKDVQGSLVAL